MEFKDYYKILGVSRDASAQEIQRSYRKLARQYHPDVNRSPDAAKRFSEINEAHEVLKDPEKRKRYDLLGEDWQHGGDFSQAGGPGGQHFEFRFGNGQGGGGFSPGGFSEFFEMLFGAGRGGGAGAEDLFIRMAGGNPGGPRGGGHAFRAGQQRSANASDAEAELAVSLQEAAKGTVRTVSLSLPDGQSRKLDVRIPPGSVQGDKLRLKGQGVTIKLAIQPDPRFRVNGRDLTTRLDIAPWEAVLGAQAHVPSLDGELTVTIPPGSQSGSKLRLKGKGIPARGGKSDGKPGDLLVELRIVVPKNPSDEQKKAFEQLKEACPFNPRP